MGRTGGNCLLMPSTRQMKRVEGSLAAVDLTNPQTWNRYAYVANNPLSRIDPKGLCSQPAGLQSGQIGICIDAYIAAPTIAGPLPGIYGFGDNRGPSGTGGTFRSEVQLVYDPTTNTMSEYDQPGTSTVSIFGAQASNPGTNLMTFSSSSSEGSTTGWIDLTAFNGFYNPYVGPGKLLLQTSVTCDASGCSINGGSRSGFPSLEAWGYQVGKAPTKIFNVQEGNSGQLGSFNANVPKGYYGAGGGGGGGWAYSYGGFFLSGTVETGYSGFFIGFGAPAPGGPRFIK